MIVNRERVVLVTGGRGFIGRHLVRHLGKSRDTLVISADVVSAKQNDAAPGRIEIQLDVRDRKRLRELFCRFEINSVFDLASITDVGLSRNEYRQNLEMTQSVVDCTERFNVDKYIFFSTQLVFRKEGALPLSDEDYYPIDEYGDSKICSEKWIRSNLPSDRRLILRPTYIWGEGHRRFRDGFLYRLAKGQMMLPASSNVVRHYGYVGTICNQAATLAACSPSELPSTTLYLSDEPILMRRFCEYFIAALGGGRIWPIPAFALRALGLIGDVAETIGITFPIRGLQANEMTRGYPVPVDSTLAITGRSTDYPTAAAAVVNWALSDPEFRRRIGR